MAGEATWRVPSLSLADEAIELFADRARLTQTGFTVSEDNAAVLAEICARLDGVPLAIELAAARVRALSLAEILDSLHDRFRLLTGGARTAVRRQQTLRASVDWSHALLTEPERMSVPSAGGVLRRVRPRRCPDSRRLAARWSAIQVLDQLTLLVDKSLVVADDSGGRTRYRLLETVRQYALEKLGESGEADAVRARHRDHYTAMAALLDAPAGSDYEQRHRAGRNSRSTTCAPRFRGAGKTPTSNWPWRWRRRCSRCGKRGDASGKGWPGSTPPSPTSTRSTSVWRPRCGRGRSPTRAVLAIWVDAADSPDQAQQALAIARGVDDPALLVRALTACGYIAAYFDAEAARAYFAEAIGLARALDDRWRLSQILAAQAVAAAFIAGDPIATRGPAEEGRDLADAIGDRFDSRRCRYCLEWHSYIRVIWPEPPHNSARWPPRLRQLTMGSAR